MELKDLLLDTPIGEMTDEEIEKRAHLLSRLRIAPERSAKPISAKRQTNADKRITNLIKSLSKEQLIQLLAKVKEDEK